LRRPVIAACRRYLTGSGAGAEVPFQELLAKVVQRASAPVPSALTPLRRGASEAAAAAVAGMTPQLAFICLLHMCNERGLGLRAGVAEAHADEAEALGRLTVCAPRVARVGSA
jgi:hypothetical protein